MDYEARAVLEDASQTPFSADFAKFFDLYVHDSIAGFSGTIEEPTGFWRYRKGFQGDDNATFAGDSNSGTNQVA
ncbi:hypothetical protein ACHMW6_36030 [Pseudoduganella sp. UC29_106]|uniref:hypothetical protein n=1 Tax=Pseudoduganella sp. UC29_106 TaxID=3374553 RepID=UPI003756E41B